MLSANTGIHRKSVTVLSIAEFFPAMLMASCVPGTDGGQEGLPEKALDESALLRQLPNAGGPVCVWLGLT